MPHLFRDGGVITGLVPVITIEKAPPILSGWPGQARP
jgi:hypothetical protein